MDLREHVRSIKDFPKEGIIFRDITGILRDGEAIRYCIDELCSKLDPTEYDIVLSPEARGFIFGMPVAYAQGKAFVPARKPGRLPGKCVGVDYTLEYATTKLEIHEDAIKKGDRVVIIDDLFATGGTTNALAKLVRDQGGIVVKALDVIELPDLHGRDNIDYPLETLISFEGE